MKGIFGDAVTTVAQFYLRPGQLARRDVLPPVQITKKTIDPPEMPEYALDYSANPKAQTTYAAATGHRDLECSTWAWRPAAPYISISQI